MQRKAREKEQQRHDLQLLCFWSLHNSTRRNFEHASMTPPLGGEQEGKCDCELTRFSVTMKGSISLNDEVNARQLEGKRMVRARCKRTCGSAFPTYTQRCI